MANAANDFSFKIETGKFQAYTDRLVKKLEPKQQEKFLRALGMKFIGEVVGGEFETPLDTGRARAGWAALADAEGITLNLKSEPEGEAKGRSEGSFAEGSISDGAFLRIRNAVPYISYLEYGSSDQAPAGFVRLALRKIRSGIKGAALDELRDAMAEANVAARMAGASTGGRR
jgi:hypothetical protein